MNNLAKTRKWYGSYLENSLTTAQVKFWLLFWGAILFSYMAYRIYIYNMMSNVSQDSRLDITKLVIAGCALFPLLMLRRLHIIALFVAIVLLFEW